MLNAWSIERGTQCVSVLVGLSLVSFINVNIYVDEA